MLVVRGRDLVQVDAPWFAELAGAYTRVVLDLGTGDGRFAYALAGADPTALVVGVDTAPDALRETSHRAARKPARGGRRNVLYVRAAVEALPPELAGRADTVHVVLPWGRLMVGTVRGTPDILRGIRAVARAGAAVRIVLNGEVWAGPVPIEARDLPEPTVEHVTTTLVPRYAAEGLRIDGARWLTAAEVTAVPSTWAKRLASSRAHARFLLIEAIAVLPSPVG